MTLANRETLTIREALPADRVAMLDLWVEAWASAWPTIDFAARRDWLDRHLDRLRAEGACIFVGVTEGDCLAGFMTIDPSSGEMDQLVTAASAQRRGVGTRLLRHAKLLSPRGVALSVNQQNAPAIRLYEREGFERLGAGVAAQSGLPLWHMRWPGKVAE